MILQPLVPRRWADFGVPRFGVGMMLTFTGVKHVYLGSTGNLGLLDSSFTIEACLRMHEWTFERNAAQTLLGADRVTTNALTVAIIDHKPCIAFAVDNSVASPVSIELGKCKQWAL